MQISNIKPYNCSFTSLFKTKPVKKEDFTLVGNKGTISRYEIRDDVLFVKGKAYTGRVRVEYNNGRKEHRDYENGRVVRSDLNGDGNAKAFYSYKANPDGTVQQFSYYEDDDGYQPNRC